MNFKLSVLLALAGLVVLSLADGETSPNFEQSFNEVEDKKSDAKDALEKLKEKKVKITEKLKSAVHHLQAHELAAIKEAFHGNNTSLSGILDEIKAKVPSLKQHLSEDLDKAKSKFESLKSKLEAHADKFKAKGKEIFDKVKQALKKDSDE
ncbi:unnamed protein product [Bursaphelenchus xylophilus]|uniref:(pine wood nematode) hypothetical protein n=1 Tax=Bursaphelenchus xylophilus TaxID=6326 RepID=A0A1I7SFE3_BURXY|nr:unnamed protein product [Bursaphelenchus xylophilus]CAG9092779.1 unnamed protein product [Bursaphelenchus xylophilus]